MPQQIETNFIQDNDYQGWIKELKARYKQSQIKAAAHVNNELIRFYWSFGRDIVKMKCEAKWGLEEPIR